jgi:hypothetical protein
MTSGRVMAEPTTTDLGPNGMARAASSGVQIRPSSCPVKPSRSAVRFAVISRSSTYKVTVELDEFNRQQQFSDEIFHYDATGQRR